ncbi:MAG: hypothetical protein AVDCRST_MAG91-952 [uncultured Sphingomonadaceae bacterium]|uniref:Uncharacterized protein n=1 Tax=uncultured Sphingomonadaceae bacterium TaxID=169976 RepID=A0A6J4SGZ4_9SPHN|nr:MAG: hypothetical protein AVDCRST_MAG91-952 [uncultured Sphingomonadaceae bacterium]
MSDDDRSGRVSADEPVKQDGATKAAFPGGRPHGTVIPPAEANDRADAIDVSTAGDGVTFFEGGDGREEARGDIERDG